MHAVLMGAKTVCQCPEYPGYEMSECPQQFCACLDQNSLPRVVSDDLRKDEKALLVDENAGMPAS